MPRIEVTQIGDRFIATLNGMSAEGKNEFEAIENVHKMNMEKQSIQDIEKELPFGNVNDREYFRRKQNE